MLFIDTGTILFQKRSFDLRFFDLLDIESFFAAIRQFPLYIILILFFIVIFSIIAKKLLEQINKTNKTSTISYLIVILLFITPNSFSFFLNKFIVYNIYSSKMAHVAQLPKIDLNATKGKNLLLIYLESFEEEYTEKKNFKNLTPFLQNFKKDSIAFKNNKQIIGADHSMAGMFTSQCGAPFQYKNTKNLVCLGDILNSANYTQVFMQGSNMQFAHMGAFYKQHGYDELYGKKELPPIGDLTKVNTWGTTDEDTFTYAYNKFIELNTEYFKNNKPFNLTLFTNDTHNGVPSKGCPKYNGLFEENNFFQSYHCTDYLLKKFIKKIRSLPGNENLIIAVIGDHLQNFDLYASRLNKMNRRVLMVINTPEKKHIQITQTTTHMDFTPTLLSVMDVNTKAKFLFGKNAINKISSDNSKKPFVQQPNEKYFNILKAENWFDTFGEQKRKPEQKIIKNIYLGANYRNLTRKQIKKYFLPNIEEYKNLSKDNDKIYYSIDDNMLFINTKKHFNKIHLYLRTSNGYYFDNNIYIDDALKMPNNWYIWIFASKIKNINDIEIKSIEFDPEYIPALRIREKKKSIDFTVNVLNLKNIKVAFYLYKDGKRVDIQWYSKNPTYILNKEKYGKGIYRVSYFIVEGNSKNPAKAKKLKIGFSRIIELNSTLSLKSFKNSPTNNNVINED